MRKLVQILIAILSVTGSVGLSYGQYSVDYGVGADGLTERIGAEGMTVLSAELNCDPHRHGTYIGSGDLGLDTGIVLSTATIHANHLFGDFSIVDCPDVSTDDSDYMSDDDLSVMISGWNEIGVELSTFNTCALTVEFVPHYDSIGFSYLFSDMYMNDAILGWFDLVFNSECVLTCSPIAAFISGGTEYPELYNLATIPGHPDIPVNAYTVYLSKYIDEDSCRNSTPWAGSDMPFLDYYVENYDPYTHTTMMEYYRYPGLTTILQPVAAVSPCDTYKLKFAIAAPATPGFYESGTFCNGAALMINNLHSFGSDYDSCTSLSVDDLSRELGLSVNPNPFSEQLKLNIGAGYKDRMLQLSLSDITGRTLLKTDGNIALLNQKLDGISPGLNPGMYFISVQDKESGHRQVFKVVKE